MSSAPSGSDWLPLDNAAKIYPAASSKLSPAVFRLPAKLRAPVRLAELQRAADAPVRRCPYFQVSLRRGLLWYYLQRRPDTPRVQLLDGSPLQPMPDRGRGGYLLRIRTRAETVAVEFSHILTDGAGGLRFQGEAVEGEGTPPPTQRPRPLSRRRLWEIVSLFAGTGMAVASLLLLLRRRRFLLLLAGTGALAAFLLALDLLMPGAPWAPSLALPLAALAGAPQA